MYSSVEGAAVMSVFPVSAVVVVEVPLPEPEHAVAPMGIRRQRARDRKRLKFKCFISCDLCLFFGYFSLYLYDTAIIAHLQGRLFPIRHILRTFSYDVGFRHID